MDMPHYVYTFGGIALTTTIVSCENCSFYTSMGHFINRTCDEEISYCCSSKMGLYCCLKDTGPSTQLVIAVSVAMVFMFAMACVLFVYVCLALPDWYLRLRERFGLNSTEGQENIPMMTISLSQSHELETTQVETQTTWPAVSSLTPVHINT